MRFFRGLAVPSGHADGIAEKIMAEGLVTNAWRWRTEHWRPDPRLVEKSDLGLDDTRPKDVQATTAVCACADVEGAAHYAWRHNRNASDDAPLLIEFEAPVENVAIDGKDCIYTIFQQGDPSLARDFVRDAFGEAGLRFAERAWQLSDQRSRIALCDLMIHDPEVIAAHHGSPVVIAGRNNIVFRSAFTVALPVPPESVVGVWRPTEQASIPQPDVHLDRLIN
jgi:hypothetical protein